MHESENESDVMLYQAKGVLVMQFLLVLFNLRKFDGWEWNEYKNR